LGLTERPDDTSHPNRQAPVPDLEADPQCWASMVDLLRARARSYADETLYTFLGKGDEPSAELTYAELDRQARRIGGALQRRGLAGERVVLLYPPGLDFVAAFFGCLYAGAVAVPAYPPRLNHHLGRLSAVLADARPRAALTTAGLARSIAQAAASAPEIARVELIESESLDGLEEWRSPDLRPSSLAFLQYTSGSTSAPKGVKVTHGNLLHNLEAMAERLGCDRGSMGVSWLPAFHDMGLIFGILTPLYRAFPCVLMPPVTFLQRPGRWLQAISRYRATHSAAPNFAYDLCADRVGSEQKARLDLSCLRALINGAEPVRPKTVARFEAGFRACGLRPGTVIPAYGLAEATLAVTVQTPGGTIELLQVSAEALARHQVRPAEPGAGDVLVLASCGPPVLDTEVRIVKPDAGAECEAGEIGEIWIAGPGLAAGYWERPEESELTFGARLAGRAAPYLRTGDLGFLAGDRLVVTGRIKELIILRGRNYYPHDLEATVVAAHEALGGAVCAAFSVEIDGEERLVVVAELADRRADPPSVLAALRQALSEEHEVAVHAAILVRASSVPRTSSGKIQRGACRAAFLASDLREIARFVEAAPERPLASNSAAPSTRREIESWLVERLRVRLRLGNERLDPRVPMSSYGLDSATAVGLAGELEEWLDRPLAPTLLYDHPTISALAGHLAGERRAISSARRSHAAAPVAEPVAIIGIGCRFPGASGPAAFWRLLRDGVDAVAASANIASGRFADAPPDGGFLADVDRFDAQFFGISPREAVRMDPQQRLLLEVAWEALEDAGIAAVEIAGSRSGVFVGISSADYGYLQLGDPATVDAYSGTGASPSIAANRISYAFDLHGPSLAIDTACSSSLVAIDLACRSLASGDGDLAIAGGVNLTLLRGTTAAFERAGLIAPGGRCRAFDAAADGYVRGEGVGLVVLKPLERALADGDPIYASIRGTAVNQDGRTNGLTAPSRRAQVAVLRAAQERAGIAAADVGYVEAHGSGTALGDAIEASALAEVLGDGPPRTERCRIGSVKSNIGHLESAAGIAGLIKVALSLSHREIPPSLHFRRPNPHIEFERLPIEVATERIPWPSVPGPALAGVSSFGMGGTNAHAVLEGVSAASDSGPSRDWQLLAWSARSAAALDRATDDLAAFLSAGPELPLADVAYTLRRGRCDFEHRRILVCRDRDDALAALSGGESGRLLSSSHAESGRPVAFLFSGLADHYPEMGRGLYRSEPTFRRSFDRASDLLLPALGLDLRQVLFTETEPERPSRPGGVDLRAMLGRAPKAPASEHPLDRTAVAHSAILAVEMALVDLLASWGVRPAALLGFSLGEYTAAWAAGVLSREEALRLVAARALLIEALPPGAMLAVSCPEEAVDAFLGDEISLAASSGPNLSVLSGSPAAIEDLERRLAAEGLSCRRLVNSRAFHSRSMQAIAEPFRRLFDGVELKAPTIPYVSNVTGGWITAARATDPGCWSEHLCGTVRFADGVRELVGEGAPALLEVGPGQGLATLAMQIGGRDTVAMASLRHAHDPQSDLAVLLGALGKLWLAGVDFDAVRLFAGERRRRVRLPTYPFERESYWFDQAGDLTLPLVGGGVAAATPVPKPSSHHRRPSLRTPFVPPAGELECRIATIWQGLLGVEEVGACDGFFELGGDSLMATQLAARLKQAFGATVLYARLFEASSIRRQAELLVPLLGATFAAIPRIERGDLLTPSFSQERMWVLHQLEDGAVHYNVAADIALRGPLDLATLVGGLTKIARRHEILRARFETLDGTPMLRLTPEPMLQFPRADLAALPADRRGGESDRLAVALARHRFDLGRSPLWRALLTLRTEADRSLILVFHHTVADGWSWGVLLGELAALLRASSDGGPPLPELEIQYVDFAAWQRTYLEGQELAEQVEASRRQLASAPLLLELPADRARPPVQTFRGARLPFILPAVAVRSFAQEQEATPFMVLLALWQALLGRYAGQETILVGSPVANRTRIETEPLIGLFVNTLVLRGDLSAQPSLRELVARVREQALAAFARQDVPFELLVEALSPERSRGFNPVFQVMFLLHNFHLQLTLPGVELAFREIDAGLTRFDLALSLIESESELSGFVEYGADLFDPATAGRLAKHYRALISAALSLPDRPLCQHELLDLAERWQLLGEWQGPRIELAANGSVFERIAAAATRTPDAVAVACGDSALSYGELLLRSDGLARRLRDLGAGPEVRVAIGVERSLELPIALLGVLASGAAYIPLDLAHPAERLALVLEDAAPRVFVGDGRAPLPRLPGDTTRVNLADLVTADGGRSSADAAPGPGDVGEPGNLAYVIYTSGSTGRPKGVQISRRALQNFVAAIVPEIGWCEREVVVAVTTVSFDIAGLELLVPLCLGARVVLAGRGEAMAGHRLRELLAAVGGTTLQATPSTWDLLSGAGGPAPELRALCGGEALPAELAARLQSCCASLHNLFGPTETTIWSAAWRAEGGAVSIGRPIGNTSIHLLDRELRLVPVLVPGELYIGGEGLARGYEGRSDLTADRFVPDPFATMIGSRLYRTGDLARRRDDGRLEFLGRLDHQVKLRGFRIELGEIESVLESHPAVGRAVVVLRDDGPAGPGLVAYVVATGGEPLATAALRGLLAARLPSYMIPSVVVELPELPLTPNGKVDRRALPAPRSSEENVPAAPSVLNPLEELLAGIWVELLGGAPPGRDASFFASGGHSLLVARLLHRIALATGVDLPFSAVFEAPTLAGFAARIEAARGKPASPALVPAPGGQDRWPLSFAQRRIWLIEQLAAGQVANIAGALTIRGSLDGGALERAFAEISRRHRVLRCRFEDDGVPVQVTVARAHLTLPVVELSGLAIEVASGLAQWLAAQTAAHRFDLARPPLGRVVLLRMGALESIVLVSFHHIVSDLWSIGEVLLRELTTLYQAFRLGAASPLPDLAVQYGDFATWEQEWLRGEVLADHLSFWRTRLEGLEPVLARFASRIEHEPRPGSAKSGVLEFLLPGELSSRIAALSSAERATHFMTLFAAFMALLHCTSGLERIASITNISGRDRPETEPLIGLFARRVALTVSFEGEPTFRELIGRARRALLEAHMHQALPFEQAVAFFERDLDLDHVPLVEFAFDTMALRAPEIEGLEFGLLEQKVDSAVGGLALQLWPAGDGLAGVFSFNCGLLQDSVVEPMVEQFEALLRESVARPEITLGELRQVVSAIDRRHWLLEQERVERVGLLKLRSARRQGKR